jgi:signal transduction histidine kinase
MSSTDKTDYKQLLSFIMHDLRQINSMIRDSSRLLSVATRGNRLDEQALRHHAAVVFEQAAVLSSWLAIADMYIDPDRFAKEPLMRVSIYDKFHMAIVNIKRLAAQRNIRLAVQGNGKFYLNAHPVIEIMPYILLDNAIKYSPAFGEITVTLDEDSLKILIGVKSMGPRVEDEERNSLCIAGFRGKHAQQHTELGTGQGLALLKTICDYHGASLTINTGPTASAITIGGIPYGSFNVEIKITKTEPN